MFIGREKELQSLNDLYHQHGFAMTVIYGRRRIGKSTLIAEFVKDKKTIFYTATKVGKERNLSLFAEQTKAVLEPELGEVAFSTLESVFDFITRKLSNDKLIIVIDELPYWAEAEPSLLSVLQKYIDTKWLAQNLLIILCGSALSFMENKVLSEKSPLFGRRTSQMKLDVFSYRDAARFVPDYSYEEKAICYGITGGVAQYLSMLDASQSLDDNIKHLFFYTGGYLYEETRNLLTQEFTDITIANNVIEQIASGENTLNLISTKVGEKEQTVLYLLDKLIHVGLVEKRKCITEENNKKKTQYVLKDHMFKFWYAFIPKAISVIEMGGGDLYYEKIVKPKLHAYMGSVFEEMCRYYTLEQGIHGAYGGFLTRVGTWWGMESISEDGAGKKSQPADVDVVAVSELDKTAVIGECKFKNERIDKGVYETLCRRAALFQGKYTVKKLLLFSLAGYTEWFGEFNEPDVLLLTLADLYA